MVSWCVIQFPTSLLIMANENHNPYMPVKMPIVKNIKNASVGENVEKWKTEYCCWQ